MILIKIIVQYELIIRLFLDDFCVTMFIYDAVWVIHVLIHYNFVKPVALEGKIWIIKILMKQNDSLINAHVFRISKKLVFDRFPKNI